MTTPSDIRAIETQDKGRWYRSRHEARWAVFLDTLGEPFQYELEGFELPPVKKDDVRYDPSEFWADQPLFYVPDFWLPRVQQWVEIKPYANGYDDMTGEKARRLWAASDKLVVIVCGVPGLVDPAEANDTDSPMAYNAFVTYDFPYVWCECPACGAIGLQWYGSADRLQCGCKRDFSGKCYNYDTPRLRQAFEVADRYRFWTAHTDPTYQRNHRS